MKKVLGIVGIISGIVSFISIVILFYRFIKDMIVYMDNRKTRKRE